MAPFAFAAHRKTMPFHNFLPSPASPKCGAFYLSSRRRERLSRVFNPRLTLTVQTYPLFRNSPRGRAASFRRSAPIGLQPNSSPEFMAVAGAVKDSMIVSCDPRPSPESLAFISSAVRHGASRDGRLRPSALQLSRFAQNPIDPRRLQLAPRRRRRDAPIPSRRSRPDPLRRTRPGCWSSVPS